MKNNYSHIKLILPEGYQVEVGDTIYDKFTDSYDRDIGYCKEEVLKIYNNKTVTIVLEDGKTRILNKIEDIYITVELMRDANLRRITRTD